MNTVNFLSLTHLEDSWSTDRMHCT